jgi:hypothetical protein
MFIQLVSFLDKPQARAAGLLSNLACAINHYEKLFLLKTINVIFLSDFKTNPEWVFSVILRTTSRARWNLRLSLQIAEMQARIAQADLLCIINL